MVKTTYNISSVELSTDAVEISRTQTQKTFVSTKCLKEFVVFFF
jgi:hypothetical protein